MKKILILSFFIIIQTNLSFSKIFMMNCVSNDYKDMAFYKYINKNDKRILNIRSMKGSWINFCRPNPEEYKVNCTFEENVIKRTSFVKEDGYVEKIYFKIDFSDYNLEKFTNFNEKKKK